jgi:hypothetical protein
MLIRRTRRARLPLVALMVLFSACTDAATRVAYDIESGAGKLGSRDGARTEIRHTPKRWPEGCAGSYTLRIGQGASDNLGNHNFRIRSSSDGLSVRCYTSDGNLHAWGTSYHLRFVDVPETVQIEKKGGETTVIDVERRSGRALVVGLR